jgi:hypothetical protein
MIQTSATAEQRSHARPSRINQQGAHGNLLRNGGACARMLSPPKLLVGKLLISTKGPAGSE